MRTEETAAPRAAPPFDGLLLAAILGLAAVGAVMVYSASAIPAGQSRRLGFDEFHYLKRQLVAAVIGLAPHGRSRSSSAPVASPPSRTRCSASRWSRSSLVPFVGKTAGGAQRWIPLGPVQFQPAEAAKVVLVLYLARSLARKQEKVRLFSIGVLPHLAVTAVFVLLCLVQSDLGTGVILFIVLLAMLFAAGARVGYLLLAAVLALPFAWHLVKSTPYRWARVMAFLDPERYRAGPGFQLWESLLGTANGGFFGQGLGQGKGKLFYLPAAHTDFIAAVIAEEAGLLGMLLLLALYAIVVWRGLRAALNASDAVRLLRGARRHDARRRAGAREPRGRLRAAPDEGAHAAVRLVRRQLAHDAPRRVRRPPVGERRARRLPAPAGGRGAGRSRAAAGGAP